VVAGTDLRPLATVLIGGAAGAGAYVAVALRWGIDRDELGRVVAALRGDRTTA
jgi:hypothetical protein